MPKDITTTTATTTTTTTTTNSNDENEHLLQYTWILWWRPPPSASIKGTSWEDSQSVRFTASTVESFWRGFHIIPRITPLHPVNCDYSLFREGIKPMWEDELNKNGGRWTYNIERRHSNMAHMPIPNIIEQSWLDVMLCLIGEGFDPYGDKISGGVCGIRARKTDAPMSAKIHIWTTDATDTEANTKIGEKLRDVLNAPPGSLTYSPHRPDGQGRGNYSAAGQSLKL